jgi:ankyrin repeat protein
LVDNDCSVNICDADGQTPLHRACSKGYVDEAEVFLKRNSNINQCNKLMKTPLILAVEGRHTKVVVAVHAYCFYYNNEIIKNKCKFIVFLQDTRTYSCFLMSFLFIF